MDEDEIREFLKERDRIRGVVGRIGGKPTKGEKAANIIFIILVVAAFIMALLFEGFPRLVSMEIGILFVSLKIAYFLSNEAKVNHFEFWILSSLEWRLNDVIKRIDRMEKLMEEIKNRHGD
ncbi:MAG: hypothetical protein GXP33_15375 [Spirochaetes bacterium]|nr:hypothetical protein [Spirochaetota bacterium]